MEYDLDCLEFELSELLNFDLTTLGASDDFNNFARKLQNIERSESITPKIIVFGRYNPRCEENECVEIYFSLKSSLFLSSPLLKFS